MTFPAAWGCASDFLKILPKYKMTARGQLQKNLWAQKLLNLVRNYSNFTITFPTIWKCEGDLFQGFIEIQNGRHGLTLIFFGGRKNSKNYFGQFF